MLLQHPDAVGDPGPRDAAASSAARAKPWWRAAASKKRRLSSGGRSSNANARSGRGTSDNTRVSPVHKRDAPAVRRKPVRGLRHPCGSSHLRWLTRSRDPAHSPPTGPCMDRHPPVTPRWSVIHCDGDVRARSTPAPRQRRPEPPLGDGVDVRRRAGTVSARGLDRCAITARISREQACRPDSPGRAGSA